MSKKHKKDKCCGSILDATSSIIPDPKCEDDCPANIGCEVSTFSSCVTYDGGDLPCLDITTGQNLSIVLGQIELLACAGGGNGNCTVKIDSTDTCCAFLDTKILSDSLSIITQGTSCKHLQIEEKCRTWNDINPLCSGTGCFKTKWDNVLTNSSQAGQYSLKNCEVRLRGLVKNTSYTNPITDSLIFILPIGSRPVSRRTWYIFVQNNGTFIPAILFIAPTGEVTVTTTPIIGGGITVSLESIIFETN